MLQCDCPRYVSLSAICVYGYREIISSRTLSLSAFMSQQPHQHGLTTTQIFLVRTINGARNPRPACGVGSSRRVDMCHVWPTMCAAATGMFGHTCWPSLRARVPAFEAPLSHLECLSSTSICHAQVCPQIGCEPVIWGQSHTHTHKITHTYSHMHTYDTRGAACVQMLLKAGGKALLMLVTLQYAVAVWDHHDDVLACTPVL